MVDLNPPLRRAMPGDSAELADLVNFAGEGMPLYLWQGKADPGEDPWQIGRARQAKKAAAGQIYVVDQGGRAIAGLTGYVIGPNPEAVADDMPALVKPLQELENLALSSWYVNVLAAYPEYRGMGHGSRLLSLAEDLATEAGLLCMSIIVANANLGARRLYERSGYRETARRPIFNGDFQIDSTEWVLLLKELSPRAR